MENAFSTLKCDQCEYEDNCSLRDIAPDLYGCMGHGKLHHRFSEEAERLKNEAIQRREAALKTFTRLFEQTMEWGCNDRAKCLYANAVYSIVSDNEIFKECEQEFLDYMHENGIH